MLQMPQWRLWKGYYTIEPHTLAFDLPQPELIGSIGIHNMSPHGPIGPHRTLRGPMGMAMPGPNGNISAHMGAHPLSSIMSTTCLNHMRRLLSHAVSCTARIDFAWAGENELQELGSGKMVTQLETIHVYHTSRMQNFSWERGMGQRNV